MPLDRAHKCLTPSRARLTRMRTIGVHVRTTGTTDTLPVRPGSKTRPNLSKVYDTSAMITLSSISALPTAHSHRSDHVPSVAFISALPSWHSLVDSKDEPFHLPHAFVSVDSSPTVPLDSTSNTAVHSSSNELFVERGDISTPTSPIIVLLPLVFMPLSTRTTTTSDSACGENGFVASLY